MRFARKSNHHGVHPSVLSLTDAGSPMLDAYRRLSRKILYFHGQSGLRTFGLTSAQVGEGKTLTSINLSLALAEDKGKRVVLLDCDFRRPRVAHYLGISNEIGLADVMDGRRSLSDVTQGLGTSRENYSVIPAGDLEAETSPLVYGGMLGPILETLKADFDFVLVDTPPVVPIADQDFISELLDAVLLVIRAGKTSRSVVEAALEGMDEQKVIGIVFNGIEKLFSSSYYYGYNYKHYYRKDVKR